MSQAASQAAIFYRDVAKTRRLWTIRDAGGFPAPRTRTGQRSQPFWSSESRAQKIIATVEAYTGFRPVEVSWIEFMTHWVPSLTKEGYLVGVNWSGPNAVGYDLQPEHVVQAVSSAGAAV